MASQRTTFIFAAAGTLVLATVGVIWQNNLKSTPPPSPVKTPLTVVTPVNGNPLSVGQIPVSSVVIPNGGGPLILKGQLSKSHIQRGVGSTKLEMKVDVDGQDVKHNNDVSLDVVLVVDCSSSMAGQKMVDARIAAQDFVMRLSDGDRAAVVAYSSNATVKVPLQRITEASRQGVQRAIGTLEPSGATNIEAGLTLASSILGDQQPGVFSNRVRRVLLLSDGQPTMGQTAPSALAAIAAKGLSSGITFTTLGLGEDYNEAVMTQLASKGRGNYYFISSSAQLAETFTREFGTLQSAVARNTSVEVQLAPGVTLDRLYGYHHIVSGSKIIIPMGEFWIRRNASVLMTLNVERSDVGVQNLATVELGYHDLVRKRPVRYVAKLTYGVTDDAAQVERGINDEVLVRYEQFKNAAAQEQAMTRYESGDVIGAHSILRDRRSELSQYRSKLKVTGKSDNSLLKSLDEDMKQSKKAEEAFDLYSIGTPDARRFIKYNREVNWSKTRSSRF